MTYVLKTNNINIVLYIFAVWRGFRERHGLTFRGFSVSGRTTLPIWYHEFNLRTMTLKCVICSTETSINTAHFHLVKQQYQHQQ